MKGYTQAQRDLLSKLDHTFARDPSRPPPFEAKIAEFFKKVDGAFADASSEDRYEVSARCCELLDEWERYPGELEHLEMWLPYCEDGVTFRKRLGSIVGFDTDRTGRVVVTVEGVGKKRMSPERALDMRWAYKAQLRRFSETHNLYAIGEVLEYRGSGSGRKAYVLWRDYGVNHASWEPATEVA